MTDKFAIHIVGGRGLIYDLEILKRLREEYHICGTLIGILPQFPQQNVFLGLPLELMPEDVRYLVEEVNAGYLVDDVSVHDLAVTGLTESDIVRSNSERERIKQDQIEVYKQHVLNNRREAIERRNNGTKKGSKGLEEEVKEGTNESDEPEIEVNIEPTSEIMSRNQTPSLTDEELLQSMSISFESGIHYNIESSSDHGLQELPGYKLFRSRYENPEPLRVTRTNLQQAGIQTISIPKQTSYDIYKHLQASGYYLSPGLRFGGQFLAYPGDPLRFHSHHIAIGLGYNEQFNVLDIVGGGRLGTTVKKCWYIGAKNYKDDEFSGYSIEWSGFG